MTAMQCKFEGETIRALRSGSWPAELVQHCGECPDCREALQVAQALLEDAGGLNLPSAIHSGPPPAAQVWSAVQRRRKLAALDGATRILRVLKVAGVIYTAVFLLWVVRTLPGVATESVLPALNGKALTSSVAGGCFAVLCVVSGLFYTLLKDERRSN
jgi:hypothetical protein